MQAELVQRCASLRSDIETHAQNQRHAAAREQAHELVATLAELRRRHATDEAIELARQVVDQLGALARLEPDVYLHVLSTAIAELARSLEARGQFEPAAAAFGAAAEAQKIAMASRLDATADEALILIELLSRRAVALAEAGLLSAAEGEAQAFLHIARAHLPRTLPQLCGGLVFLADLETELGRARAGVEHLREGFELLLPTLALPGAREAVVRLGQRLRDAARAADVELPAELAATLAELLA